MPFSVSIKVSACDALDNRLGAGRFAIIVARQASATPVQVIQSSMTGLIGQPLALTDVAVLRVLLTVDVSDYTKQSALLVFDEQANAWTTNNSHVVVSGTKSDLTVVARLGCIRYAPIKKLSPAMMVKADFNPAGALLESHSGSLTYRGHWLENTLIGRLADPIFGKPDADGWDRFGNDKRSLAAKDFGTFALLEFGFPAPNMAGRPRYLVGVWYPNKPLGETADVNVFFSPNTGDGYPPDAYPYAKAYPYQTKPRKGAASAKFKLEDVDQPYLSLAENYVCVGYKLVYQMLAAGKNAIIVMPIQPSAQWGVLQTIGGVWRLVIEAVRFGESQRLIARKGKVAALDFSRDVVTTDTDSLGIAEQPFNRNQMRLTTSAFSAGLSAIFGMMSSVTGRGNSALKDFPASHFGASEAECLTAWKALWDIDGGFHQLGEFESCVTRLLAWRKGGSNRTLLMYHSEDTVDAKSSIVPFTPELAVKRRSGKVGFVEQGYSQDRSLMWALISNSMLRTSAPDSPSNLWPILGPASDAHHMVPTLGFGHAWLIS
jgi:hypothetical protein